MANGVSPPLLLGKSAPQEVPKLNRSYLQAALGKSESQTLQQDTNLDSSVLPELDSSPVSSYQGKPAVFFSISEQTELVDKLKYVLIGKFSHGRPSLAALKVFFEDLKLMGSYNLSIYDNKHVFIELELKIDYIRIWLNLVWTIKGCVMRIFKWHPDFSPLKESSLAPVWIRLEGLPLYLFDVKPLCSIANAIGKPLRVDKLNMNRVKLNSARVCVELDVALPLHDAIWVGFKDGNNMKGFWVKIFYDFLPSFCSFCDHIGHGMALCKRKKQNDIFREGQDGPNLNKGKEVEDVNSLPLAGTEVVQVQSKASSSKIWRAVYKSANAAKVYAPGQHTQLNNKEVQSIVPNGASTSPLPGTTSNSDINEGLQHEQIHQPQAQDLGKNTTRVQKVATSPEEKLQISNLANSKNQFDALTVLCLNESMEDHTEICKHTLQHILVESGDTQIFTAPTADSDQQCEQSQVEGPYNTAKSGQDLVACDLQAHVVTDQISSGVMIARKDKGKSIADTEMQTPKNTRSQDGAPSSAANEKERNEAATARQKQSTSEQQQDQSGVLVCVQETTRELKQTSPSRGANDADLQVYNSASSEQNVAGHPTQTPDIPNDISNQMVADTIDGDNQEWQVVKKSYKSQGVITRSQAKISSNTWADRVEIEQNEEVTDHQVHPKTKPQASYTPKLSKKQIERKMCKLGSRLNNMGTKHLMRGQLEAEFDALQEELSLFH